MTDRGVLGLVLLVGVVAPRDPSQAQDDWVGSG